MINDDKEKAIHNRNSIRRNALHIKSNNFTISVDVVAGKGWLNHHQTVVDLLPVQHIP